MRWAVLYMRSRRVPEAMLAATLLTAVVWALTASYSHHRAASPNLVMLAASLAVAALSTTLSSTDDALDRTAALPWPARRATHLLGLGLGVGVLLLLTMFTKATVGPVSFAVRDALGLTGLAALGALVLGPHRAWFPVVAWSTPVVFMAVAGQHQVLTWMIQPANSHPATLTALALATSGIGGYAVLGPPRRAQADLAGAMSM